MSAVTNAVFLSCLCLLLCCSSPRVFSKALSGRQLEERAALPPRGWNSYDSFSWTITEKEFLQNAEVVSQKLHAHGYEYVVVDYLWYRRKVDGAYTDSKGFDVIDEWGRMIPDPVRWPSSKDGKGFTEVAKKVHSMGLKFGIHVMRGISTQAVNANTPILDTKKVSVYEESGKKWRAKDIALQERACAWMPHGFMSVNTSLGAGRAFLRSLYAQYANWGVDFVKHDCVFGDDLDKDEIRYVSEVLRKISHPILYSLSPGTGVTPAMAKDISGLVNMYRITGDDWDTWPDVAAHFNITRDFSNSNMIGAKGLLGKSWPDSDMLPLGSLTDPGSNEGPHRISKLNLDEQRTQMTLWAMAKSPLMFGGDLRSLDQTTYSVITNPTILEINHFSSSNKEFPFITGKKHLKKQHLAVDLRSQIDRSTLGACDLGLTNCKDFKAKGWSVEGFSDDLEQVCWKINLRSNRKEPFCLYKRKSHTALDEDRIYKQGYQRSLQLSTTGDSGFCLDAFPRRKLATKSIRGGSFSPCRQDSSQWWKLNTDGTLTNNDTGLCATVNSVKATVEPTGIRSWAAIGRAGEIYVAFFNLNRENMVISANIPDLAKVIQHPRVNLSKASCSCKEAWSGQVVRIRKRLLSTTVEAHGCALFVLHCT